MDEIGQIRLAPLRLEDEALVDALFDRLTSYSMLVDGLPKPADAARQFLTDLPPGVVPASKHVFAVLAQDVPVGLVDVVQGYPRTGIAFIGLLAIAEDRHGEGIGATAFRLLEDFSRDRLGASVLRLAVVEGNPAIGFWRRMGFAETGEIKPYRGADKDNQVRLMEKSLA